MVRVPLTLAVNVFEILGFNEDKVYKGDQKNDKTSNVLNTTSIIN